MRKLIIAALVLLVLLCVGVPGRAQNNKIAVRPIGQMCYNAGGTGGCLAFSATPIFDAGLSNTFKITLTANVTSSTMIGLEAGQFPIIEVCQDGTGSRTFAFPAQFAGAIAVLSGANACIAELFYFDGTTANIITTTTAGGGGSGTINSGTGKCFTWYATTGTTVSNDCNLDDGLTTAATLTYAGAGGVSAVQHVVTGPGAMALKGTEGACPAGVGTTDILCLGDSLSHTAKICNNGGTCLTVPQYSNDSPTPFGPLYADSPFPRIISAPVGVLGQPLLSGGPSAPFGYGAMDVSSSNNVTGRIQKANIIASALFNDQTNTGTSAFTMDMSLSSASGAFREPNIVGCSTTTNGVQCYNSTTNNFIGGMNSGNAIFPVTTVAPVNGNGVKWVVTSGNIQLGDTGSPAGGGGGGTTSLSSVTAATVANTIDNGDNAQQWRFLVSTAGKKAFRFTEPSASTATGTPWLLAIDTVASSTLNPLSITALGTTNGVGVLKSSFLTSLGTGGVDSNLLHCDVTDGTKCAKLVLSGITTATTRNVTVPDAASTIVVPDTGASNNFLTAISASGAISKAQPAFNNLSGSATCAQLPALTGDVTTSAGTCATAVGTKNKTRTCMISVGADNGSALVTADIQPQKSECYADVAMTVYQILVKADAGASTIQLAYRHSSGGAPTTTNYTSAVLTPAAVTNITDKVVCANAAGTAITVDGISVTCSTLATQTWTAGDSIESVGGTADATTKRLAIFVSATVN